MSPYFAIVKDSFREALASRSGDEYGFETAHRSPLVGEMPSLFAGPVPPAEIAEPALLGDVLPVRVDDGTIADSVATVIAARTTAV